MADDQLPESSRKQSYHPTSRPCEKPVRWTDEEHEKFIAGLKKFGLLERLGPGGAELMASYLGNRTVLQIRSHMQQYRAEQDRIRRKDRGKRNRACAACRRSKAKCDGVGACSRCKSKGIPCEEYSEDITASLAFPVEEEIDEEQRIVSGNRRGDVMVTVAPERPVAFPDGIFSGYSTLAPDMEPGNLFPQSLTRLLKGFWIGNHAAQRMLNNMTPKLRLTVLHIFRAIDSFITDQPPPGPPSSWSETQPWQCSMRCGFQIVRYDIAGSVMSGIDVNQFWSDLAGLHKEEIVSRGFNGDMNLPTSELRQFSKLVYGKAQWFKTTLAGTGYEGVKKKPLYSRFSRGWGRGGITDGVLVRTTTSTSCAEPTGRWVNFNTSLVVVPPEEFEAVRATHPELCEGYLIPVVGSKSAQELMDPQLLVEESFEHMRRTPEGVRQMDKLADVYLEAFSGMFDYFAQRNLRVPSP
mmetsp:Transcript_46542/g.109388  ORF Transcript_46542/g.109388 Transcript_46542/m.109388 type:complete len:466 (+) Transcript_46542:125-1522(+)